MHKPTWENFKSTVLDTPYGKLRCCFNGSAMFDETLTDNGSRAGEGLTINNVVYHVRIDLRQYPTGWDYSPDHNNGKPSRYAGANIRRKDWTNYNDSGPSAAALKKIDNLDKARAEVAKLEAEAESAWSVYTALPQSDFDYQLENFSDTNRYELSTSVDSQEIPPC